MSKEVELENQMARITPQEIKFLFEQLNGNRVSLERRKGFSDERPAWSHEDRMAKLALVGEGI